MNQETMNQETIQRFRERLQADLQRLRADAQGSEETRVQKLRAAGELSNAPTHTGDRDVEGLDETLAVEKTLRGEFQDVVAALERIEDGTYGTCQRCKSTIAMERLEALPWTPYCIECECAEERGAARP
jgi:RNA polymerase-binding transcription factor DksA